MKKGICCLLLAALTMTTLSLAGAVPESLRGSQSAQVFFGEVKSREGESLTVIQRQNVKGAFQQDREITYPSFAFTEDPQVGERYLCGYLDANNPLYIWEVTGFDTKTLEIRNADDMSRRMEESLHNGDFDTKAVWPVMQTPLLRLAGQAGVPTAIPLSWCAAVLAAQWKVG